MAENAETAQTAGTQETQTPAPAAPAAPAATATPETKTYTDAELQAREQEAKKAGYREAQSHYDQRRAQELRQQQDQNRTRTTQLLRQVAPKDADAIAQAYDVYEKAQAYEEMTRQQAQMAAWNDYVSQSAIQAGLQPDDPRLSGAGNAVDLARRIADAIRADERAERTAEHDKAERERLAALKAKAESGDLDTLGAAPAGAVTLSANDYKKEMLANRGKGMRKANEIKAKYRAAGIDVDRVSLTS